MDIYGQCRLRGARVVAEVRGRTIGAPFSLVTRKILCDSVIDGDILTWQRFALYEVRDLYISPEWVWWRRWGSTVP